MSVDRVENLRSWQLTYKFKLAVYELVCNERVASDLRLSDQLRESAASAVSQMEEGFARFYPKDHAKFVVGGKASLLECCGHVRDAVDRGHLAPDVQRKIDTLAREALREIAGLIDYLQSPEAEENARRIRAKRAERRKARRDRNRNQHPNENHTNEEAGPQNHEPGTERPNKNLEPGTRNRYNRGFLRVRKELP